MSEHLDRMDRERAMSESTSRSERRALRKVAGAEVFAVLDDTHEAIRSLQQSHSTIAHQFAADSAALHKSDTSLAFANDITRRTCDERCGKQADTNDRLSEQHTAFVSRTFWQRLRWFLTGR